MRIIHLCIQQRYAIDTNSFLFFSFLKFSYIVKHFSFWRLLLLVLLLQSMKTRLFCLFSIWQVQKPKKANGHAHAHSHSSTQMNMRGAFLHVLSDALGSIIVVISALVVWLTEWKYRFYLDPALSIFLVILILNSVWPLLRESALILLQTVPTHIQVMF